MEKTSLIFTESLYLRTGRGLICRITVPVMHVYCQHRDCNCKLSISKNFAVYTTGCM